VTSYLQELFATQVLIDSKLNFNYTFTNFTSVSEFTSYVANPQYLNKTAGFEGVCFGYQITENAPNNYNVELLFNDQILMGGNKSVGIPSQLYPSWSPSATEPKFSPYVQYANRGYSML
jgi:hypothetical protein